LKPVLSLFWHHFSGYIVPYDRSVVVPKPIFIQLLVDFFYSSKKNLECMKHVFSFRRNLLVAGSILLAGIVFTACNKSNFDNDGNSQVAGLMAFNLAPEKSAIGISLSGSNLTNVPLTYSAYTGTYLGIYPGSRIVESYDNSGWSVASPAFTFEPDKYYSVFVAGANDSYRNIIVQDNFDSLSGTSGQAYIRYINAIPDSAMPMVSITANGTFLISEQIPFAGISEFKAVAPGQVNFDINNGGTIDADRTITVEQRKVYTILLIGKPGATTNGVEIKFVENGTLDDEAPGRRVSPSAQTTAIN
jgi:hypothetical protein